MIRPSIVAGLVLAGLATSFPAVAQQRGDVQVLLHRIVEGMPTGPRQEVRVLRATMKPGERTVPRAHPWPVTTYVLQGAITLDFEGQKPRTVKAGEVTVEPPNVEHTAINPSTTESVKLLMFYVSDPGALFMVGVP